MTKRTPRPADSQKYSPASDRKRAQDGRWARATTGLWARIRAEYPAAVRQIVDEVNAGGLTYADLRDMEMAEHERLGTYVKRILDSKRKRGDEGRQEAGARSLAALCSTQLQCRKNLRHLVTLMGVGKEIGDKPVVTRDGVATYAELNQRAEEIAAQGDEIIN